MTTLSELEHYETYLIFERKYFIVYILRGLVANIQITTKER